MKKYLFLLAFAFSLLISCISKEKVTTTSSTTTYYLIRHAEKDRSDKTNNNPNLNFEGEKRAQNWANYFKDIQLDAVYSTNYNRTIQTATPTAQTKNLEIIFYNPTRMYDSIFQKDTKGKSVLVVGHSNTTPSFVNKILEEEKYENISDTDNSKLFIVTIHNDKKTSKVESIN